MTMSMGYVVGIHFYQFCCCVRGHGFLYLYQGYIGFYHDIIEQAALIAFEKMPSLMSSSLADETQTAQVLISIRIYNKVSLLSPVYIVFNTSY